MTEPDFPGAVPPERQRALAVRGIHLNVLEWGDPQAPPLLLTHGMWDHARSFAVLAPVLARRFRVVAMDACGHGDSEWAGAYTWMVDVLDIVAVVRALGRPVFLVGHSKGGGQATDAARMVPELVRKLVNIDGFGPPSADGFGAPHSTGEPQPLPLRFGEFLDHHRKLRDTWRPYPRLDDLVERRRAQNPRLSHEWLTYFAYHGARLDADGWRWKSDPQMALGFGPWTPEWIGPSYTRLRVPLLAIIGSEPDTWGPLPEAILGPRLSGVRDLERCTIGGAGHFVHIERPAETAQAILDYVTS